MNPFRRLWSWYFEKPFSAYGKTFRSQESLSKYVWKRALKP